MTTVKKPTKTVVKTVSKGGRPKGSLKPRDGVAVTVESRIEAAKGYLNGGYEAAGDVVPSIAGLAITLGITRSAVHAMALENPEFGAVVEGVRAAQERKLLQGGLSGTFNSTITKLILTKHGYSDSVKNDLTSSDGSMSLPSIQVVFEG